MKIRTKKIERSLSYKRMFHQKKYSVMILLVMILACLLMQVGFQVISSIRSTFLENRLDMYGEWERIFLQIDEESEELLALNPFLEKQGEIAVYGVLAGGYQNSIQSNVGTISTEAWELGRIKMKSGRLPQTDTEIAMEYSTLVGLGYEAELGQEITLDIIPEVRNLEIVKSIKQTYTLSGIIKDYQINWSVCNSYRFPTAVVTTEGAEHIGNVLETHCMVKSADDATAIYEDIENSSMISGNIVANEIDGQEIDKTIPYEEILRNICLLIVGATIGTLFVVISQSISERTEFWKFLDALGMETKQMYQMIAWEAVVYFVIASMAGLFGGIGIYNLIFPAVEKIVGRTLKNGLSMQALMLSLGVCMCMIAVSYFLSAMRIPKIINGKTKKNEKWVKGKTRNIRKFTPTFVVLHKWRYTYVRKCAQILLLASAFWIIGFGILNIKQQRYEMAWYKQITGNGYYLDLENIENVLGIKKPVIEKLSFIDGVETIETYYSNEWQETEFYCDFSEYSENEYLNKIVETERSFRANGSEEMEEAEDVTLQNIRVNVLSADDTKTLKRFLENLSEGEVSEECLERGDFCILCLPPLVEVEGLGYLGEYAADFVGDSRMEETKICVGDVLKIGNKRAGVKEIKIDGILRSLKNTDVYRPLPSPSGIQIITGKGFWKEFGIDKVDEYYQIVKIAVSEDADVLDTEEHIYRVLKSEPTVQVTNFHEEYQLMQQEFITFIGVFSVFLVFYIILIFVVLYQMMEIERMERRKSMEIFRLLGMEEAFIRKVGWSEKKLILGIAFVISVAGVVVYSML